MTPLSSAEAQFLTKPVGAGAAFVRQRQADSERAYTMELHHPLTREFPEHVETIRRLKLSNRDFQQMFDEYHKLDDAICRVEEEVETATDQQMDEMKMRRAQLKDRLYTAIRAVAA